MEKTLFIKPTRPIYRGIKLDPLQVAENTLKDIETTIILDTNILICMERVVNRGNKWSSIKKQGLDNLIKLLQKCPPKSICISPGLAFNEMPPKLAEQARKKYELFCSAHLPNFIDIPNCIHTTFKGKKRDYGYKDLSLESQAVLAVPFASILYLNLIDNKSNSRPLEKFKEFLDKIESKVDIFSAAEIEIAKYCFANPPANCRETIELRGKIRNNFLKTNEKKLPKSASEVMAIAFNGACDLHLLQAANVIDQNGIGGKAQDSWIATKDKKLVEFSKIFHHVNFNGEAGKYAIRVVHPEHLKDIFWMQADDECGDRRLTRKSYNESREIDLDILIEIGAKAIEEIERDFEKA